VSFWVWIAVIAGLALFIWLVVALIGTPKRRRAAQREKAAELRREAEEKLASAARREVTAKQETTAARHEREAAEQAMLQAEAIDPELPDSPSSTKGAAADERDREPTSRPAEERA
jgi:heme exporter protein D